MIRITCCECNKLVFEDVAGEPSAIMRETAGPWVFRRGRYDITVYINCALPTDHLVADLCQDCAKKFIKENL